MARPKSVIRVDRRVKVGSKTLTFPQLKVRLEKARASMADFSKTHKQISILLDRWVQLNFRSEGGKVGGWAPLKAGGRWVGSGDNRSFDQGAKILQDTGRLRLSFIPFATRDRAGIGSDEPYSAPHDRGAPRRNLPQRRMLPEENDVGREIDRIYQHHVTDHLKL